MVFWIWFTDDNNNKRPMAVLDDDGSNKRVRLLETETDTDSEPAEPHRLDWRDSDAFSDATIELLDTSNPSVLGASFHVHRSMLIQESSCFRTFFEENENETVCRLTFDAKAIQLFPAFLDYVYTNVIAFDPNNAVVFYHFGKIFGMKHLRWEAQKYIKSALGYDTLAGICKDALQLGESKIMDLVKEACGDENLVTQIHTTSPILDINDSSLWKFVLERLGATHSRHLSLLIAKFCDNHPVNKATFLQLTSDDCLPVIDVGAALLLLNKENMLCGHQRMVTNLQRRCIAAIVAHRKDFDTSDSRSQDTFRRFSSVFLTELVMETLAASQLIGGIAAHTAGTITPQGSPASIIRSPAKTAEKEVVAAAEEERDERNDEGTRDEQSDSLNKQGDKADVTSVNQEDNDKMTEPAILGGLDASSPLN